MDVQTDLRNRPLWFEYEQGDQWSPRIVEIFKAQPINPLKPLVFEVQKNRREDGSVTS